MLTFFTTAKPFRGHNAVTQRNALLSWSHLHPDVEIIIFGDDEGTAEVCQEFGFRHLPRVSRTPFGAIRLDDMFGQAQQLARHQIICYVNCDIILTSDFLDALRLVREAHPGFLMVGRRWDTDVTEPLDFFNSNWASQVRQSALQSNSQRDQWWIDYFAFSRGLYGRDLPPLGVGRSWWDNYLVWNIVASGKPVVDASPRVVAIHQNHDYSHHPQGWTGAWKSPESQTNFELAGRWGHLRNIADGTEVLDQRGLRPNHMRHWRSFRRAIDPLGRLLLYRVWSPLWLSALHFTRPLRTFLGWRTTHHSDVDKNS
jgi:hypothetical protein